MNLVDLDDVRDLMRIELERDLAEERFAHPAQLTPAGRKRYPDLLLEAIASHEPAWLAERIEAEGLVKAQDETVVTSDAFVPIDVAMEVAERDFNHYYMRAVCVAALENGGQVEIYYARDADENKRANGEKLDAAPLLNDLRERQETSFGVPTGFSNDYSVRLPGEA